MEFVFSDSFTTTRILRGTFSNEGFQNVYLFLIMNGMKNKLVAYVLIFLKH